MIVRKCSQGHKVKIYRNTTPGVRRVKTYTDGTVETIEYPDSKAYFVSVDGSSILSTDSLEDAENRYTEECEKKHPDKPVHGRLNMGKHKSINHVATQLSDYPTSSNTVAEIKFFLDVRDVQYKSTITKSELLEIVEELKNKKVKITVKGVLHD